MKTIHHLGSRGRALASALGIRARPIPGDHLHPWVLPQPLRHRLGGTIREQCHGLPALQVYEDRAIRVPFPQSEIVHPKDSGSWERQGLLFSSSQQRISTHRHC